jgi:DtxR family Mn-dependent transcriptional regulator
MRTFEPTQTKEDYLRAMFRLYEEGKPLRLVDLASSLGLSKSTVSERVQELAADGYVTHEKYAPLSFTRRGLSIAKKLTDKHRLVEVFLHQTLHIPKDKVHAEAHMLEHAVSDMVADKLRAFLGNPKVDPHGMRIAA